MKISDLEKLSGFSRDTIRYYERQGLLTPPVRMINSYRVYTGLHLRELFFIRKGREIGFSLEEIKHGTRQFALKGKLCKESVTQLKAKKEEIRSRIQKDRKAIQEIEKLLKRSFD